MSTTRAALLADLEQAGRLVEQRARPAGTFGGWDGRDVLCHLAAYVRLVAGMLRGVAEKRSPTERELYGQLAAPGPAAPPGWSRPHLADVVTALVRHYAEHMRAAP